MKTNNRKQTKLIPTMHKANKMWVESNGYREQNIESIKRKENKEILYGTMNNRHRFSGDCEEQAQVVSTFICKKYKRMIPLRVRYSSNL